MPELARLTWPEARAALEHADLGLVAVGSCEQHGPHMTLDTDFAIADALARRLANELGERAILCPPLQYGLSEHHLAFPGTLTLRPETFLGFLADLVESLAHWGLRRLLVVNGHGGNVDAIRLAARNARRDHGSLVAGVLWAHAASDEIASRVDGHAYGHACEVETSVALVLAPQTVHRDRIAAGGRSTRDALTDPPNARVDRVRGFEEWTDDGALGDPRSASVELGEAVVAAAHARASEFARAFAGAPLPGEARG